MYPLAATPPRRRPPSSYVPQLNCRVIGLFRHFLLPACMLLLHVVACWCCVDSVLVLACFCRVLSESWCGLPGSTCSGRPPGLCIIKKLSGTIPFGEASVTGCVFLVGLKGARYVSEFIILGSCLKAWSLMSSHTNLASLSRIYLRGPSPPPRSRPGSVMFINGIFFRASLCQSLHLICRLILSLPRAQGGRGPTRAAAPAVMDTSSTFQLGKSRISKELRG